MRLLSAFVLFLALLAAPAFASEESVDSSVLSGSARLLVQKQLSAHDLMPYNFPLSTPINVTLLLANIGDGSAYNVRVSDNWAAGFELVDEAKTQFEFEEIPAGETVSVSYFVKPTTEGGFESTPAKITYQATKDGEEQTGYSSSTTNLNIISEESFNKLTSTHSLEYTLFFALLALFVAAPAMKYQEIASSFQKGGRRKAE